ncbi:hypothetical protein COV18_02170 [Candidatus Woesearchaeota archaeon CG10_big_fil_rev_8_21_14_0_10_37_12]|nr:MAG: hypothetical protein COV18_02170 [Candidatus Woesearchaeota archaeon CG10_big_fil_rev_8_21_14_0_10_37_12]
MNQKILTTLIVFLLAITPATADMFGGQFAGGQGIGSGQIAGGQGIGSGQLAGGQGIGAGQLAGGFGIGGQLASGQGIGSGMTGQMPSSNFVTQNSIQNTNTFTTQNLNNNLLNNFETRTDTPRTTTQTLQQITTTGTTLPRITSSPVTTARVNFRYHYQIIATQPNNQPLAYLILNGPNGMSVTNTGRVSWTPNQTGQYNIQIGVKTQGTNLVTPQSYTITVTENQAPEITSQPTLTAIVGQEYVYQITATDADGDRTGSLPVQSPQGTNFNIQTQTLTWTPTANQVGQHTFKILVGDSFTTTEQQFTVTVRSSSSNNNGSNGGADGGSDNTNRAPVITSTPITNAAAGTRYTYDVEATDADNNLLTYALLSYPQSMRINFQTGVITWIPTTAQAGNNNVRVVVSDGRTSTTQDFIINVAANALPQFVSSPINNAIVNQPYTYNVDAIDPNNDNIVYALPTKPTGMTINPLTGIITWIPTSTGFFNVTVSATDGGQPVLQLFTIHVQSQNTINNHPPVITSTPIRTATAGTQYLYVVLADDADGDTKTFNVNGPSGMTINSLGVISWTPNNTQTGNHPVSVSVTDGTDTASQTYTLTVQTQSQGSASWQTIPTVTINQGATSGTIILSNVLDRCTDPANPFVNVQILSNTADLQFTIDSRNDLKLIYIHPNVVGTRQVRLACNGVATSFNLNIQATNNQNNNGNNNGNTGSNSNSEITVNSIIIPNAYDISPGSRIPITVSVRKTTGPRIEDVQITATIQTLGARATSSVFDIEGSTSVRRTVFLQIPGSADPGIYTVRISIDGRNGVHEQLHRQITIR